MMFRYKVEFLTDEPDLYKHVDKYGQVTEQGLVAATSHGQAVNLIVDYYVGKDTDNLCSVKIYECENPMPDVELVDIMNL